MKKRLRAIQKTFTLSIMTLVIISLVVLTSSLIIANVISYRQQVSEDRIAELVANQPEVAAYVESQKMASPHFVALATKVKQEQQRQLMQTALLVSIPVIVISLFVGRLIAKKLLFPVEDSFRAQERFIQDAAHELRNPLAAMSAGLEAAQLKKQPTAKDYESLIEKLSRQTRQLIAINEDLLFLQKKAEPYHGKTNVSELTRTILTSFGHALKDKNVTLHKDIARDTFAAIRPKDYEIIVRNLVDNAIKYSPHNGTVTLRLYTLEKSAVFMVMDRGMGIPEKELELVTKRFYRASNTGNVSGSGLGLALVQKVADSYGGSLKITSKQQRGTVCTLTLPLYTKN